MSNFVDALPPAELTVAGRTLRVRILTTQRPGGRRILAEDASGKRVFDTDDCYDAANAINALDRWVVKEREAVPDAMVEQFEAGYVPDRDPSGPSEMAYRRWQDRGGRILLPTAPTGGSVTVEDALALAQRLTQAVRQLTTEREALRKGAAGVIAWWDRNPTLADVKDFTQLNALRNLLS